MTSDRATVLGNIAASLHRGQRDRGAVPHGAGPAANGGVHRPPVVSWPMDLLIERFSAELAAIAGRVHRPRTMRETTETIVAVCREHGALRVLAWAPQWIPIPGLHGALEAAGVAIEDGWLPDGSARPGRLGALEPITVGITGAFAGIAESGTFAVVSGPGRPRLASLLPRVHIAVLAVDRIVPSVSAFFAAHPQVSDEGSNLVLVTGPSRTADIEMTLTRGVHGPGEVHVVLIDASSTR